MLLGQDHFPDRVRYTLSPDEIGSGSLSSSAGEFRYTLQCRCDRAGDVLDLLFRDAASAGGEWGAAGEYRSLTAGGRINFDIADFGRNH